jgi:hypothetical protein
MKTYWKILAIFIAAVFVYPLCLQGQEPTRLYGRLQFDAAAGGDRIVIPIKDFKIEIFEREFRKGKKPLAGTYPDNNGYFVFKDIPEGWHTLVVSRHLVGREGLVDEKIEQRKIHVRYNPGGRQRLHDIRLLVLTQEREERRRKER